MTFYLGQKVVMTFYLGQKVVMIFCPRQKVVTTFGPILVLQQTQIGWGGCKTKIGQNVITGY